MRTADSVGRIGIPALVLALVVTSVVGFYPGYLSHFPRFANSGWQVHFHLATIVAWLVMLVVQARLATTGRIELHRRVGRWSYGLVPLIVVGFVEVTLFGQRRHPEPALIGATILDGTVFLTFYVLAIVNRRNAAKHARYMMLTGVAFVDPALGRAISPLVALPVEILLIVAVLLAPRRKASHG